MTGKVLEFRRAAERHEVVRLLEQKLARARRGELDGLILLASTDGEAPRFSVCGSFAERPRDAGHALIRGLHALIERIAQGGNATPINESPQPAPDRRPQWLRDRQRAKRLA